MKFESHLWQVLIRLHCLHRNKRGATRDKPSFSDRVTKLSSATPASSIEWPESLNVYSRLGIGWCRLHDHQENIGQRPTAAHLYDSSERFLLSQPRLKNKRQQRCLCCYRDYYVLLLVGCFWHLGIDCGLLNLTEIICMSLIMKTIKYLVSWLLMFISW